MTNTLSPDRERDAKIAEPTSRNWFGPNDANALHEEGAKRFGRQWLDANKQVIRIARNYGIDPSRNAAFLSDLAFEICWQSAAALAVLTEATNG